MSMRSIQITEMDDCNEWITDRERIYDSRTKASEVTNCERLQEPQIATSHILEHRALYEICAIFGLDVGVPKDIGF